jgi:CIC family chloride channel protein
MIASSSPLTASSEPSPFRLIVSAAVVGILAGVAAAAFHSGVDKGYGFVRSLASGEYGIMFSGWLSGWLAAALLAGFLVALAAFLVRRFTPEAVGSGINEVEGVIHHIRPPLRWQRVIPVKFVGGLAAMTSGLVIGREGPTVHIGAAFGTMIGHAGRASVPDVNVLVSAGAGAGLAAAFNAPLAGILFVCEELDTRFLASFAAMQSATIASVIAVTISSTFFGQGPELVVGPFPTPSPSDILLLIPLGAIAGALGVFFNWALLRSLDFFRRLGRVNWLVTAATVGAAMGLVVAFYPDASGGGEALVVQLLKEPYGIAALLCLLIARFVAFLASYGCGTPGGLFAPLLALGALVGLLFAALVNYVAPDTISAAGTFALSAIAALLAATVRAPLTGIALAAALTDGYNLVLAMIVASLAASLVAKALGGQPIYSQLLERSCRLETEERGRTRERRKSATKA